MTIHPLLVSWSALILAATTAVAGTSGDLVVDLRHEAEAARDDAEGPSPALSIEHIRAGLALTVTDGREVADAEALGQRTTARGETFAIRAAGEPLDALAAALPALARTWGIGVLPDATYRLEVRVARLELNEDAGPDSARYAATVQLDAGLRRGVTLVATASAVRDARRDGRARSAAEGSAALDEALVAAFAALLEDPLIQLAWAGQPVPITARNRR